MSQPEGGLAASSVCVGIDLVQVSRIADSVAKFGDRFLRRVFTDGEIAYAQQVQPPSCCERLAARFAAKEATVKALGLAETGVGWRQIEVERQESGKCLLVLHGRAREAATEAGVDHLGVSLSHEGDYATAVVFGLRNRQESTRA